MLYVCVVRLLINKRSSMTMLEYSKIILENVSFDASLFLKELKKASKRLLQPEAEQLLIWCVGIYQFP